MSLRLTDPSNPKAVALVELINKMKTEEAERSKNPDNKTQMKTTKNRILKFTEPS